MKAGLLLAATLLLAPAAAMAEATLQPVRFPPGKSGATIHGGIVRGDAIIYVITAKQGQAADFRVTSIEDNADLKIYQPPSRTVQSDDGLDVAGPVLPGGEITPGLDEGATRHWHGALPASGAYYVVVSGDRGNVTFALTISIR